MKSHNQSFLLTFFLLVGSFILVLESHAISGDCPDVQSSGHNMISFMGGEFDNCNARIVGPDQVCPGDQFSAPYFVVGEARNCSTINWELDEQAPSNADELEDHLGDGADGAGNCDLWFVATGNKSATGKEVTVKVETDCPGKFDITARANQGCKCGEATKNVDATISSSSRSPICSNIKDADLCQAWRQIELISNIAEATDTSVSNLLDNVFKNDDGFYRDGVSRTYVNALEMASNNIPNPDEDQHVPEEISNFIDQAGAADTLQQAAKDMMEDVLVPAIPIGTSDDLANVAELLEEYSVKMHPCNNERLSAIAKALN